MRWFLTVLLIIALVLVPSSMAGCRKSLTLPTTPLPSQSPSSSPNVGPTPAPASAITSPLRVVGNRFSVPLKGAIICCYDPYTLPHKWPLIDESALREIAANGGNYTHVRPTTAERDGLGWNDLKTAVATAQELGIYVEVDVLDGWAFRHRMAPWQNDGCDVMASEPKRYHRQWIHDLVQTVGAYPNVLWHVGNENFLCNVSKEWELGVRDALREYEGEMGYERHLIGTNSENEALEAFFDYSTWHVKTAKGPGPVPRLVNEYRITSAEQYKQGLKDAAARGTYFMLWRGEMDDTEWLKALGYLRASADWR